MFGFELKKGFSFIALTAAAGLLVGGTGCEQGPIEVRKDLKRKARVRPGAEPQVRAPETVSNPEVTPSLSPNETPSVTDPFKVLGFTRDSRLKARALWQIIEKSRNHKETFHALTELLLLRHVERVEVMNNQSMDRAEFIRRMNVLVKELSTPNQSVELVSEIERRVAVFHSTNLDSIGTLNDSPEASTVPEMIMEGKKSELSSLHLYLALHRAILGPEKFQALNWVVAHNTQDRTLRLAQVVSVGQSRQLRGVPTQQGMILSVDGIELQNLPKEIRLIDAHSFVGVHALVRNIESARSLRTLQKVTLLDTAEDIGRDVADDSLNHVVEGKPETLILEPRFEDSLWLGI